MSDKQDPPVAINVGSDGKYRWLYEQNVLNNPKRVFLWWRLGVLLILVLTFYVNVIRSDVRLGIALGAFISNFLLILAIFSVLILLLGFILRQTGTGSHLLLYEMDSESLIAYTLNDGVECYEAQQALAIMSGQMKGDPVVNGSPILTKVKKNVEIKYHAVSSVAYKRIWRLIRVKSGLRSHDIYAKRSQAEYVLNTVFTKSAKARMAKQDKEKHAAS